MNELKKHLDEKVFAQNPFNDQIKHKMINSVLKSSEVKHKRKGPIIAMISAACIILLFAVTALEAPGLFGIGTSASGLEQLQKQHPEMKASLETLSPEFRKNIKVPTYFPFKIKKISLNVTPKDKAQELAIEETANFFFGNDGKEFIDVDMYYFPQYNEGGSSSDPNQVKLEDGTIANLTLNKNASLIRWFDKKAHIEYSIGILVTNGYNPYGKEDLLKMANSMR